MRKVWKFRRGAGGGTFCGSILENLEGRRDHMVDPLRWGGMDIF